ncbi:MAG: hypothetical protein U0575_10395 [Phycisphaerales bacterium]
MRQSGHQPDPPSGNESSGHADPVAFAGHCRDAALGLRSALLELYHAAGADPARPQEVSRRFKLNKNLTWKIARLLQSDDAFDAAPLIPGANGLRIVLEAMRAAGAPAEVVNKARSAAAEFQRMVEAHAGDRATLELLLDATTGAKSLEVSRKLAYRGNSGVWGLQARLRLTAHFLAPCAEDPSRLDIALVAGLFDLRRLRPLPPWPLFRFMRYRDDASPETRPWRMEPIERPAPGGATASAEHTGTAAASWLMRSWCSPQEPALVAIERDGEVVFELGDGAIGRTGDTSCVFGFIERNAVPRHGDAENHVGEVSSVITLPIETLLFDLFVHRDLPEAHSPQASIVGRPSGALAFEPVDRDRHMLPMGERMIEVGGRPPRVATPLLPRYEQLVATAFARAGWNAEDFVVRRLVVPYPPMPSTVVLRYELPRRAGT